MVLQLLMEGHNPGLETAFATLWSILSESRWKREAKQRAQRPQGTHKSDEGRSRTSPSRAQEPSFTRKGFYLQAIYVRGCSILREMEPKTAAPAAAVPDFADSARRTSIANDKPEDAESQRGACKGIWLSGYWRGGMGKVERRRG